MIPMLNAYRKIYCLPQAMVQAMSALGELPLIVVYLPIALQIVLGAGRLHP
jgi:hypothetical protein